MLELFLLVNIGLLLIIIGLVIKEIKDLEKALEEAKAKLVDHVLKGRDHNVEA
jgi:hypothetical protein